MRCRLCKHLVSLGVALSSFYSTACDYPPKTESLESDFLGFCNELNETADCHMFRQSDVIFPEIRCFIDTAVHSLPEIRVKRKRPLTVPGAKCSLGYILERRWETSFRSRHLQTRCLRCGVGRTPGRALVLWQIMSEMVHSSYKSFQFSISNAIWGRITRPFLAPNYICQRRCRCILSLLLLQMLWNLHSFSFLILIFNRDYFYSFCKIYFLKHIFTYCFYFISLYFLYILSLFIVFQFWGPLWRTPKFRRGRWIPEVALRTVFFSHTSPFAVPQHRAGWVRQPVCRAARGWGERCETGHTHRAGYPAYQGVLLSCQHENMSTEPWHQLISFFSWIFQCSLVCGEAMPS